MGLGRKKKRKNKKNKPDKKNQPIVFPVRLLEPIKLFLTRKERKLRKREEELIKDDPFQDTRRLVDNDTATDADEQAGHERITALKEQVARQRIQIKKSLARIKLGRYGICEKCNQMIDTDRLMVMAETTLCTKCAQKE